MSDVNRVLLTGRLTADPDLRYTQSGQALARFTVAVNRVWQNPKTGAQEKEENFIPIVVWGKQGENCAQYLRKGRLVAVDGRLRVRSFTTQNGDRRRISEVVAQSVHFLGSRPESAEMPAPPEVPEEEVEAPPEEEVPF
ncbi:single-stranded DNA-binding protein [Candidatus Bipolaricaulota bacterium]|nr:single-stranded DNA-binding protein [Candidatus Bipolaricaulota bacterium]